jgi:hypothetical protein
MGEYIIRVIFKTIAAGEWIARKAAMIFGNRLK